MPSTPSGSTRPGTPVTSGPSLLVRDAVEPYVGREVGLARHRATFLTGLREDVAAEPPPEARRPGVLVLEGDPPRPGVRPDRGLGQQPGHLAAAGRAGDEELAQR